MKYERVVEHIVNWLKDYCKRSKSKGFIIGISGGIDSAVTSTLCAKTNLKLICLEMNIHQKQEEIDRANEHIQFLKDNYQNVSSISLNLTESFQCLRNVLTEETQKHGLAMANTRSRLRMCTLYAIGQANGLLVAGTGNKIEDFGVGFYTKYGDGGVDLSPIADLTKTQVYGVAKELNVVESIRNASPTDGLWDDERTDESQIGATYPELEWAMDYDNQIEEIQPDENQLTQRQQQVLQIYRKFHQANKHKMIPIPICEIPNELK